MIKDLDLMTIEEKRRYFNKLFEDEVKAKRANRKPMSPVDIEQGLRAAEAIREDFDQYIYEHNIPFPVLK